ncbi:MAG TPA: hypothetical protein VLE99_05525 [Candidatus Saccharimonadales bacterium]|nr:hypothetical protein [Candidatus Saccharimonadales bacterium]
MPMQLVISLAISIPLVIFWAWMFSDMTENYRLAPQERQTWLILFIFLSIFTAGYYYFTQYRDRD